MIGKGERKSREERVRGKIEKKGEKKGKGRRYGNE